MGWLARYYGFEEAPTPVPEPMTDADRIIAEQRRQGAQTRELLVWIFLGIPAIILVVGVLIWVLAAVASQ